MSDAPGLPRQDFKPRISPDRRNGEQRSFADMSSAQRSASMDATVRQVTALTSIVRALDVQYQPELGYYTTEADRAIAHGLHARIDNLISEFGDHLAENSRRIDTIERGAAVLSAWVQRPIGQRVRERVAAWWVRFVAR